MKNDLANTKETTSTIDEMVFTPLIKDKIQSIRFGSGSPTYIFENVKKYYAAFSTSNDGKSRYLKFTTYLSSGYLPASSILVPQVIVLDKNKEVIPTVKFSSTMLEGDISYFKGVFYTGNFPLPDNAVYLIFHAADDSSNNVTAYSNSGKAWVIPISPAGEFEVTLK